MKSLELPNAVDAAINTFSHIPEKKNGFDSHDVINHIQKHSPEVFEAMRNVYSSDQVLCSVIANYIRDHKSDLVIKLDQHDSMNIHGNITTNRCWRIRY